MKRNRAIALVAGIGLAFAPVASMAQNINITTADATDLPFTLIYPEPIVATESGENSMFLKHPSEPLQCEMSAVPVEDTDWTADAALAGLDDAEIATSWEASLPGFAVTGKGVADYQNGKALTYEGDSIGSELGVPVTLVHFETVSGGHGYVMDCFYATVNAAQSRPVVDFIMGNFATVPDAQCCRVQLPAALETEAPAQ